MSESKHTPGPWRNRYGIIFGTSKGGCRLEESDFMVAQIRGWGHLQYLGEKKAIAIQEANARLIAAAPALLEACKSLLDEVKEHGIGCGPMISDAEAAIELAEKEG